MAISKNGHPNDLVEQISNALAHYQAIHPRARIDVRRHDDYFVNIRVISPDFRKVSPPDRHDEVWGYLKRLPRSTLNHLGLLVLLTPREVSSSGANVEFENPVANTVDQFSSK